MEGRWRGDGVEMQGRCRGDAGLVQGRPSRAPSQRCGAISPLYLPCISSVSPPYLTVSAMRHQFSSRMLKPTKRTCCVSSSPCNTPWLAACSLL